MRSIRIAASIPIELLALVLYLMLACVAYLAACVAGDL